MPVIAPPPDGRRRGLAALLGADDPARPPTTDGGPGPTFASMPSGWQTPTALRTAPAPDGSDYVTPGFAEPVVTAPAAPVAPFEAPAGTPRLALGRTPVPEAPTRDRSADRLARLLAVGGAVGAVLAPGSALGAVGSGFAQGGATAMHRLDEAFKESQNDYRTAALQAQRLNQQADVAETTANFNAATEAYRYGRGRVDDLEDAAKAYENTSSLDALRAGRRTTERREDREYDKADALGDYERRAALQDDAQAAAMARASFSEARQDARSARSEARQDARSRRAAEGASRSDVIDGRNVTDLQLSARRAFAAAEAAERAFRADGSDANRTAYAAAETARRDAVQGLAAHLAPQVGEIDDAEMRGYRELYRAGEIDWPTLQAYDVLYNTQPRRR